MVRILRPASISPSSLARVRTCAPRPPIAASSTVTATSWVVSSLADQLAVERLGEAQVGDRRRQAPGLELVGGLLRLREPRAERQDRDLLALADDPALADLERLRRLGQRHARALAARIAHRDRAAVVQRHGVDHVDQLGLVGGGHHHEIGQGAEISEVEAPAWVAPSAPTSPARSIAKRTGRFWIATSWTTWS